MPQQQAMRVQIKKSATRAKMNKKTPNVDQLSRFKSVRVSVISEVKLTVIFIPGYLRVGGGPVKNGATDLDCDLTATCCWNDDGAPNAEMAYVVARDDTFLRESAFATYFPSSPKPGTQVSLLFVAQTIFYFQSIYSFIVHFVTSHDQHAGLHRLPKYQLHL